jgi:hypothetical protein
MVRQPKTLAEAKQIVREERLKLTSAISVLAGSRWLLAILATFVLAFGTHLLYAPTRLPAVAGVASISQLAMPAGLDFGVVGEQAGEALDAAQRQDVSGRVQEFTTATATRAHITNAVGFGLALILLVVNMVIMTKRRRTTRG